jgi:hypothetical protein
MARKSQVEEEITMDLPRWWASQPPQVFEVVSGDGGRVEVSAHEAIIGSPQPTLSLVRYEIREVEVIKTTGGTQNKQEVDDVVDHPIMVYAASFNAGAWISIRDIAVSARITPLPEIDENAE